MEDEERQKKLEAGKAKLAQFRQRKAQNDAQNPVKKQKQKKKKKVANKGEEQLHRVTSKHQLQGNDARAERGPAGDGADFIIKRTLHSGDVIKQDQTYTIEPESEVSTTADDYTSEANDCCTVQHETLCKAEDITREEECSISEICSEHDTQPFQTRLEIMEDDLAAKHHEVEELNRELEELRSVFGTEGFQQLQDFEAAVKQRDGIITQLTDNLQQARKEKDEILQEFLDLTEQSQKLQIQFQQLQAGEAVRSTSHGTTAAGLIHSKQQLVAYQMQSDEQEQQLKTFQKMNEECQHQIRCLQAQLQDRAVTNNGKTDKGRQIEHLENTIKIHESASSLLKDKIFTSEKILCDLNERILQKNQESENLKTELINSKQRERQSSDEIKHLMGNIEALQKRCHMGNLSELETVQRIEIENHRKMEQLQAELDEMYGKQIVQMKQELQQQHISEMRKLTEQHKSEMGMALGHSVNNLVNEEQIDVLNMAINELNTKLRDSHFQRDQIKQDMTQQLEKASEKQLELQEQVHDLLQELNFTKGQIRKASENISDHKYRMHEVEELKDMIGQLKTQLIAAAESNKELKSKHEAEVTNYKIKLDMLEREKDEVLDRMAGSQEAELERLRTQLLFSHEEELTKLKEDLERDHNLKVSTLQEQLSLNQSQKLVSLQKDLCRKIEEANCERDSMILKNNQLLREVSLLKEKLQLSQNSSEEAEMRLQIGELEMEIEALRKDEKEKTIIEKGIVELQGRNKCLEEQIKEQVTMKENITVLQEENEALKEEKNQLEEKLNIYSSGEASTFTSVSEHDLSEMRGKIERLTVVNEQLKAHERELKEEVERQRNTFSFAEKNFEVNFQELRDEYDCLLKMKSDIEEKMMKQEIEYETKLKVLSEQRQLSELTKDTDNFTVISQVQLDKANSQCEILGSKEVIEKDTTELMEKLEIAQQDKKELTERLSDLSEVLILRQNELLHLKEELKFLKEQANERCKKTDIIENQKLTDVEMTIHEDKMSRLNLIKAKNESQSNQPTFSMTYELKENEQQENLMEQVISLQNSMKIIVLERDELQQNQVNLVQEKESLLTEINSLREKQESELSDSLSERDHHWHQLESLRAEQSGLAEPAQQKSSLEEILHKNGEEIKNTFVTAQQERLAREKIKDTAGDSICELNPGLSENQAELKLQLMAQRISLTQIHAAQMELVRDSLKKETEVAHERLQEKLTAAHALEINELQAQFQQDLLNIKASQKGTEESSQMLMERLSEMISGECVQLSQSFASTLGEDYLLEKRKLEEESGEALTLGNTDDTQKENQLDKDHVEEAKGMQTNLERLKKYLFEEYNRLVALQTQLTDDFQKIEDRQAAYLHLKFQMEEENVGLRMQIESSHASSQDLNDLKEQLRIRSARLEEIVKLKQEFCLQKAELQEQHAEEIKSLKTTYEQQYQEMEAKYTGENISLQQKLQKMTGFVSQSRTGINAPAEPVMGRSAVEVEKQRMEEYKAESKADSIQEQQWHMNHPSLLQQEPNLKKALHGLEEHCHQNQKQMESIVTHYSLERKVVGESADLAGGEPNTSVQSLNEILSKVALEVTEEQNRELAESVHHLQQQYEERLQEEIAKVIVQMSVQFAQQTEMARVSRDEQDKSNTCRVTEESQTEMEPIPKQDLQFDTERNKMEELFSEEKGEFQRELTQKNTEALSVERQMQNVKIVYKLGTHDVISEADLQEEFLNAEQELFSDFCATGNSNLKEMSLQCKMEINEFENQELAQERLEDLRQELVRQDQEYQQSLEALRQLHAQQLERLQDDQEQLLAEMERLKGQLQESIPDDNVNVVLENESMLAELEKLKCLPAPGEETPLLGYCDSSTQTEMSEREDQHISQKHSDQSKNIPSFEEKSEEANQRVLINQSSLQKANDRLLKVLLEVVKTTAAAEETINRHVSAFVERSVKGQPPSRSSLWEQDEQESIEQLKPFTLHSQQKDDQSDSYQDTDTEGDTTVPWSGGTTEELELDHHFTQTIFSGGELDSETEELVLHVGTRLQVALEKLLEAITETANQLAHARITRTKLVRDSVRQKELIAELRKRHEELQERVNEELKAREQLALELHKAESVIDGYTEEKANLERQIREKDESRHQIAQELQHTSTRLQELEEERQQLQQERDLIARQQVAMKENAGSVELRIVEAADAAPEAELLEETEKLMKEKREVQRQAEKEQNDFTKQVKLLECELEEQVILKMEIEQEKSTEILDLQQQILALEKQLEKNRKFLDEQAIDREQERDVFQQEILKLEHQLKTPQRLQSNNDQRNREMDHLTDQLKDKTDRCSELLLAKEQLQRDVQERNEEIDKLENRVREQEQTLIRTTCPLQKAEERKLLVTSEMKGDNALQIQLQAERDALERKEKEIGNLEEQLEQFREELLNKNEEVQQLHMQLEIQRKESATQLQEIQQENKQLKNEVVNLLPSTQSPSESSDNRHSPAKDLSRNLREKDEEIVTLNEQIITMQQQLELFSDNKIAEKKDEQLWDLEAQIEYLKSDQERLKKHNEEEVEQLNEVIEKLQQELMKVMPLDVVPSEKAENLKHQLDMMMEKELLQQQVDKQREEVISTKQKLEEQSKLLQTPGLEFANITVETKDNFTEGSQETINNMKFRMQELQVAIIKKEKKLDLCQLQIQNLREQAQTEARLHEKQILALEDALREKVATVLVSQVQLKAVQQQIGLCREQYQSQMKESENVSDLKDDTVLVEQLQGGEQTQLCQIGSKESNQIIPQHNGRTNSEYQSKEVIILRKQLTELQQQLIDLQKELELEKQVLSTTQQEAEEKEKKLTDLRDILEKKMSAEQDNRIQTPESLIAIDNVPSLETPAQLGANSITNLVSELNQVKAEAAITKEELNNYREQTEKLQEDLQAKEQMIIHLQEQLNAATEALCKAEEENAHFEPGRLIPEECKHLDGTKEQKQYLVKERQIKIQANSTFTSDVVDGMLITRENATEQFKPSFAPSEEITNIKCQCSERIDQLQELHAVEMTKLEKMHFNEMEVLKRDYTTQINTLTEKDHALKAMAHVGSSEPSATLQFRDRDISGQEQTTFPGTTRKLNNVPHTAQSTLEQGTENLPDKIKSLLHEVHLEGMQVLSLSESPYLEEKEQPLEDNPDYWHQERQGLLDVVQSLKDVLSKIQGSGEAKTLSTENITDWRRELLQAVQHVFNKEHDAFIMALHAQAPSLNNVDAMKLLNLLKEQETQRRADVQLLMTADRNSMMMEIRELWSYLQRVQQGHRTPVDGQEYSAQRMELLENNLKQKQAQILTLQMELNTLKAKGVEFQDHQNSEKMLMAELKSELSQTKLELETTLKAQHQHLKELEMMRVELSEKAAAVERLNTVLEKEQKKFQELEWAVEKERCKPDRKEEHDREKLEDLKVALEDQKRKHLQLECALEKERTAVSELRQSIDSEKALHKAELSQERSRITELQIVLDAEKTRACELNSAFEQERQLSKQLQSAEKTQEAMQNPSGKSSELLLLELQKQVNDQRNRTVELVSEMEKYKLESFQLRQRLEEQQQIHRKSLLKEQESHRLVLEKVDSLQLQAKELLQQLEKEKHEVLKLQREKGKLKETLLALHGTDQVRSERAAERRSEMDVTEKVPQTEATCKTELSSDRTRDWIIQQKLATTESRKSASVSDKLMYAQAVSGAELDGGSNESGEVVNLESIRQKLQLIISKLSIMVNKAANRIQGGAETTDENDLIWLHNSIQDLALRLQQLQIPVFAEQNITSTGSTSTLIERILRQNADLTGFVSRLSEEKNDLHNSLLKLEEEVRKYRQLSSSGEQLTRRHLDNQDCVDTLIKSERTVWSKEKSNLQQALKLAEAELAKMKAEARNETLQTELFGSGSENIALKRIYGKYLRAESFRKALIYQKKYLLLLLGGFQECEQATLSFIARMAGHPSYTSLQVITQRSRSFTRFRSVVRVAIAISRLKFLVRRWQKATVSSSLNRNGHGQILANELRMDSPFLHSGTLSLESSLSRELFGDRRHCTSRQRSGQESPRSATNTQPRYQSSLPDSNSGSIAASHLQTYDPDRALTDYINRLESLQRRLGTVQSGSASYAQMHYGTRR
ncbi:A-kinase anchor protein 9 isoform X5 [Amblyraja radiata]|uniref:A-kinase anchor protein 9 isoform X5 n=1 Tax=Amblyraja radiata TaxID=386614 RepID=UPI001402DD64|nr:A-kinase anchor protein 9 isoform X5 [Amblyraja radiata]